MHVEVSAHMDAAPEAVFAVLADMERWPRWMAALKRVEVTTEGPTAVGSKTRDRYDLAPLVRVTQYSEITEYEPPRLLALRGRGGGVSYEFEFVVVAAEGGTRVDQTVRATFALLLKPIEPLAGILFRWGERRNLRRLARIAEAGPPAQ